MPVLTPQRGCRFPRRPGCLAGGFPAASAGLAIGERPDVVFGGDGHFALILARETCLLRWAERAPPFDDLPPGVRAQRATDGGTRASFDR